MKLKQRLMVALVSLILLGSIYTILHKAKRDSGIKAIPEAHNQLDRHEAKRLELKHSPVHPVKKFEHKGSINNTGARNVAVKGFVDSELERLRLNFHSAKVDNAKELFQIAASWVAERQMYPRHHPHMASILKLMATAKIIKADVLPKGTQIKLLLVLEGGQKVVFKQKRYARDYIIEGKPYDGYDRHNAEIAAFHLDRIFDFHRAPLVVGRIINLQNEVIPVATKELLQTFRKQGNNLCYFGKCLYCSEKNMACADGETMEGSITLWLPDEWTHFQKQRHPYQRTYIDGRSAKWEVDESYCETVVKHKPPYDKGPRLLDVTDGAVFDYLIGNADRHHYETFKDRGPDVMMLMLDNAKSFGNPNVHEPSILAPIRQCCILRNSTWNKLHQLKGGVLSRLLEAILGEDPIAPVLHPSHLNAVDVRLPILTDAIQKCIDDRGRDKVLMNEWTGI